MSMSVQTAVCVLVAGRRQAAGGGDVGERAVAVVAQQRLALRQLPAAAQHQDVEAAVVVVVGLHDVQAAELIGQAGLRRPLGERAVAVAAEELHRLAAVEARRHDVEPAVVVEVVDDHAAGRARTSRARRAARRRRSGRRPPPTRSAAAESAARAARWPDSCRRPCARGSAATAPRGRRAARPDSSGSSSIALSTSAVVGERLPGPAPTAGSDRRARDRRRCPSPPCAGARCRALQPIAVGAAGTSDTAI